MSENTEVKEFIQFIETYLPVSQTKPKKLPKVPALVIPEFTLEEWEYLKETGDWRKLKEDFDKAIARQK